jgi:DivIVA domain-containing protein
MRRDKVVTDILGEEGALSPSDICAQEFHRATMGGYRTEEVDNFLERVADTVENLINQAREMRATNDEYRERLDEYRQMEQTLRSALVSAQHFSETMVEAAKREAAAIVEEARLAKRQMEVAAAELPEQLAREVRVLRQQRDWLRVEMTAVLDTHRKLIEGMGAVPGMDPEPVEKPQRDAGDIPFVDDTLPAAPPWTGVANSGPGQPDEWRAAAPDPENP